MLKTASIAEKKGHLRPLNILRDLPDAANLIELCFRSSMDSEGKRYLDEMRATSRNTRYLNWAATSMPLKGYVWETQKELVGNISIVNFRQNRKNILLFANIAVHPDHRRQGIARQLTQKALEEAQQRGVKSIWLQVEENNKYAIQLYKELGFKAHSRRTTWITKDTPPPTPPQSNTISSPSASDWAKEKSWLNQNYPPEITWYRMPNWETFKPGLKYWLHKLFVESALRQWAIHHFGELQAVLLWEGKYTTRSPIWLAASPQADEQSLSTLLLHARHQLRAKPVPLHLDYPADQHPRALEKAGFSPLRTLLWMEAKGAV